MLTRTGLEDLKPGDRVVCAMSGGVDSSVAAALLKEQGFDVVGLFMRSGVSGEHAPGESQGCCSIEDSMDARRVADELGIPFYALNMEQEFGVVMDDFVSAYAAGETPNPCVQCNRHLKFGHLLSFARKVGAKKVCTGHYARLTEVGARLALVRPEDRDKDQSYVLFVLSQEQLAHTAFPLSALQKPQVRALARDKGFTRVAGKKDSVEICFVTKDYRDFVEARLERRIPGAFVTPDGEVLGQHDGIHRFTIGQRRGLGMSFGRPVYVLAIEPESGDVVLGDASGLERSELTARDATWMGMEPLAAGATRRGYAQIRYNHPPQPARFTGLGGQRFRVTFDEPERAITPGQAVVLTDEEDAVVLGGGWIERASLDV